MIIQYPDSDGGIKELADELEWLAASEGASISGDTMTEQHSTPMHFTTDRHNPKFNLATGQSEPNSPDKAETKKQRPKIVIAWLPELDFFDSDDLSPA